MQEWDWTRNSLTLTLVSEEWMTWSNHREWELEPRAGVYEWHTHTEKERVVYYDTMI